MGKHHFTFLAHILHARCISDSYFTRSEYFRLLYFSITKYFGYYFNLSEYFLLFIISDQSISDFLLDRSIFRFHFTRSEYFWLLFDMFGVFLTHILLDRSISDSYFTRSQYFWILFYSIGVFLTHIVHYKDGLVLVEFDVFSQKKL